MQNPQWINKEIQEFVKRTTRDQARFIPGMEGWLNIRKLIIMTLYINKLKNKIDMIIFDRCRKTIWQNSTYIYDKHSQQTGREETSLNIKKSIHDKTTVTIILTERIKAFSLTQGTRERFCFSPLSFYLNTLCLVLEVLARAIRYGK